MHHGIKVDNRSDGDVKIDKADPTLAVVEQSPPDVVKRPGRNTIQHARVSPPSEATKSAAVPKQGANSINIPSGKVDYGLMRARQAGAVAAIGETESGFSKKEAYSDALNKPTNNANVRKIGAAGADYGYFQMNQTDVWEGVQRGMDPDTAQHLAGGGQGGAETSTREQQTDAVDKYLQVKYPEQYKKLGETGDYEKFRTGIGNKWFGPKDHPAVARTAYDKTVNDYKAKIDSVPSANLVAGAKGIFAPPADLTTTIPQ